MSDICCSQFHLIFSLWPTSRIHLHSEAQASSAVCCRAVIQVNHQDRSLPNIQLILAPSFLAPFTTTGDLVGCTRFMLNRARSVRNGSRNWRRPLACAKLFRSRTRFLRLRLSVSIHSSSQRSALEPQRPLGVTKIHLQGRLHVRFHSVCGFIDVVKILVHATSFQLPRMDVDLSPLAAQKVFGLDSAMTRDVSAFHTCNTC